jgi:hypothetical protein
MQALLPGPHDNGIALWSPFTRPRALLSMGRCRRKHPLRRGPKVQAGTLFPMTRETEMGTRGQAPVP